MSSRALTRAAARALASAIGALALVGLLAAGAQAATYTLRPSATNWQDPIWVSTPAGVQPHVVLAQPVSQPAAPASTPSLTASGSASGQNYVNVSVAPAPALRAGETVKTTTAWVYLRSGSSQSVTISLWSAFSLLGSTTMASGLPPGWHQVSSSTTLTADQLRYLSVGLQASGSSSPPNASAFAAYVQVDTADPPPVSPPATPGGPPPAPTTTPTAREPKSESSHRVDSPVSLSAQTVTLAPSSKTVPVILSCATGTPHGCSGELVLSLPTQRASAKAHHPRAVAARCARGCRVLGRSHFSILAGRHKKVNVHLAHGASRLFGHHSTVRINATTVITAGGHPVSNTSMLTLRRSDARPGPRPQITPKPTDHITPPLPPAGAPPKPVKR